MREEDLGRCPSCGATLKPGELASICPRCLVGAVAGPLDETIPQSHPPSHPLIREINSYFEDYEILECIGRGGMGVVYRAHQHSVNREVAIKILPLEMLDQPDLVTRFRREAEAMGRLNHRHLVSVFDYGETGGLMFIVMELIEGGTLAEHQQGPGLSLMDGVAIMRDVSTAAQAMHEAGIVHRDIKPSNIMIRPESNEPVLMDLGLSKDTETVEPTLTLTGRPMGTPYYMAPEQAAGQRGGVGPEADIWSLGAVLYELACGRPPFTGTTPDVLHRVQTEEVESPRAHAQSLSRDLQTICLKALAHSPRDRYRSAAELAGDLAAFIEGRDILARPTGPVTRMWRRVKRRPAAASLSIGIVLALVISGFAFFESNRSTRLAGLHAEFEQALEQGDWSEENLAQLEDKLGRIEAISAESSAASRATLANRYRAHITQLLGQPRLTEDDFAAVEEHAKRLERHDSAAANIVRQHMVSRGTHWEDVAVLMAPFENLDEVFPTGSVTVVADEHITPATGNHREGGTMVPTKIATSSHLEVELEAELSWMDNSSMGVAFTEADRSGYGFTLSTASQGRRNGNDAKPSFREVLAQGGFAELVITRDEAVLARSVIPISDLPSDRLRILVRRGGNKLTFRAGSAEGVAIVDIFPVHLRAGGRVELTLSPDIQLSRIRFARLQLPSQASPLEQADELYLRSEFAAALGHYREQGRGILDDEQRQELQVKQALCLLQLRRNDEAGELLRRTLAEPGDRWPAVAACELWLLCIADDDLQEANEIFDVLLTRYAGQDLSTSIPFRVRQQIIESQFCSAGDPASIPTKQEALRLEKRVAILELISRDARTHHLARWDLFRALHGTGQSSRALEVGKETLARHGLNSSFSEVHEIPWILGQTGHPAEALEFIAHWRNEGRQPNPRADAKHRALLIDRARVLAGAGEWDEAAKSLKAYQREREASGDDSLSYYQHSRSRLLWGFIMEASGDSGAAIDWWTRGLALPAGGATDNLAGGFDILHWTMLATLSEAATDEQTVRALDQLLSSVPAGSPLAFLKGTILNHPDAIRRTWDSPDGHATMRDYAVGKLAYRDVVGTAITLATAKLLEASAFAGQASPTEAAMLRQMTSEIVALWLEGDFNVTHLGHFFTCWKGFSQLWPVQKELFPQQLRGPMGYLLGRRLMTIGKPDHAIRVLRLALEDEDDDQLRSLTKAALRGLDPPSGAPEDGS